MRRLLSFSVVIFWLGAALIPAHAQGGLTAEEEAALDDVRVAFENFIALDSYTAVIDEDLQQEIYMELGGQTLVMVQVTDTSGTVEAEQAKAPNQYDNQHVLLTQKLTQQITGAGMDQTNTVGPIEVEVVVVNDRIYMRLEMPEDLAGLAPSGWQDVTGGAGVFPGMEMFNIEQLLELGGGFNQSYVDAMLDAVTGVELLGETTIEGRALVQYRLTLDPRKAFESIGSNLVSMFNAQNQPFDVAKLIELMFTDEDTAYAFDVTIGVDDQMIYEFNQNISFDIEIGPDVITDPSLQGMTMTMKQTQTLSNKPVTFNEPVEIVAPVVGE